MDYETLPIQPAPGTAPADGIRCLVLNRPEVMNAMHTQRVADLRKALHEPDFADSLRVRIPTGAGERGYSTGGDQPTPVGAAAKPDCMARAACTGDCAAGVQGV
ncbi:MAG: enoyl-CoA hydratase/isomerase family protein [Burkholderiaceae bacterium]|nr:enoyl-CoA hydratase/isomerase family protein [Burkholderiaceae bacterium]